MLAQLFDCRCLKHSQNCTTCHKIEEIIICIAQNDGRYKRVQYHYGKILFKKNWRKKEYFFFLAICYIIEGKSNVCSYAHKQIHTQTHKTDGFSVAIRRNGRNYLFFCDRKRRDEKNALKNRIQEGKTNPDELVLRLGLEWLVWYLNTTHLPSLKYHMWALTRIQTKPIPIQTNIHAKTNKHKRSLARSRHLPHCTFTVIKIFLNCSCVGKSLQRKGCRTIVSSTHEKNKKIIIILDFLYILLSI